MYCRQEADEDDHEVDDCVIVVTTVGAPCIS